MYNFAYNQIAGKEIAESVKNQGYFSFEKALTDQYVEDLLTEVNFQELMVNTNDVGAVRCAGQRLLTHCLAKSKLIYDLVTSPQVLEICQHYFTDNFQLFNSRFYESYRDLHMPWHSDNKFQINKNEYLKHFQPGLQFLFYLSDVDSGEFQYLKDSHIWSRQNEHIFYSDREIEENYQQDIISFKMPKGSFVIFDIHGVHRPKPHRDRRFARTTLIFQVNQFNPNTAIYNEKKLINTEYIDNPSPEILNYLGFGYKSTYSWTLDSSLMTMTSQDLFDLQKHVFPLTLKALMKRAAFKFLPYDWQVKIKDRKTQKLG